MGSNSGNSFFKSYSLEITILVAALLVSSTMFVSFNGLAASNRALVAGLQGGQAGNTLAGTQAAAGAGGQTGGAQQAAVSSDWSLASSMPFVGPADAKVSVIEFADFQCPYCAISFGKDLGGARYGPIRGTATNITNEYAKTGKIKFIYVPVGFLGQESIDASNAALCAKEIGGDAAFFQMHDKIFTEQGGENSGTFSKVNLKKFGADIGFTTSQFTSCIDSDKHVAEVQAATAFSNAVGVPGTPAFGVNNRLLPNGAEYASLKAAVDAAITAAG